jgi:rhomboid protease GluP
MPSTMGFTPVLVILTTFITLIQPRQRRGWRAVAASLLCMSAIGAWIPGSELLQTLSFVLWVGFLFLPSQLFPFVEQLLQQEHFGQARGLMGLIRWLHPFDGWWHYPGMIQSLGSSTSHLEQTGRNSIERLAIVMQYRLTGDWQGLIDWVDGRSKNSPIRRDANVQVMYLQALGETHQPEAMMRHFEQIEPILSQAGQQKLVQTARMCVLAFTGQPDSVNWLLSQKLRHLTPAVKQYWQGTAYWMAGLRHQSQPIFKALLALTRNPISPALSRTIADRITHPAPSINPQLSPESRQVIGRLQSQIIQESQQPINRRATWQEAPVTYSLIAINVLIGIVFGINNILIQGIVVYQSKIDDRIDGEWLNPLKPIVAQIAQWYEISVLEPVQVIQGDWWQLITAAFLHASPIHLLMNMLGLYILGGLVEPLLGRTRFAIGYLLAAVGSMGLVTVLSLHNLINERSVVGASGAIMGVLGMMGAIFWRQWRNKRDPMSAQRLQSIVMIVIFQTLFDAITPHVSMAGHLSGVIVGLLVGLFLIQTLPVNPALRSQK